MGGYGAICIERQYGSGGTEIGKLLGERLMLGCHDHEILDMALDNLNLSAEEKKQAGLAEETSTNSFLFGLSMLTRHGDELPISERVFNEEARIINRFAGDGKCVFVGRCAGYILKSKVKTLNVYIYADYEKRFNRAITQYGIPDDKAEDVIKRFDKKRSDFYRANTKCKWDDKENYHLCLNSGKLGLERCAVIIAGIYLSEL